MRLHYAKNTIAVASAIALQEAGLEHDLVELSFANAEQTKSAYLAINSKGRVPALEVGNAILTETGAILEYIAAVSNDVPLMPSDPLDAAHARMVIFYLATTMHVNHAHRMRGSRWASKPESLDDMAAKVPETMAASAAYVEAECLRGPYVTGSEFCIADAYLFAICCWLDGDGVVVANYPKITQFMETMSARASVKAVKAAGILT